VRAGSGVGGGGASANEFEGEWPLETHTALGGIHGLGDAKAERPEIFAVGKGCVPVEHGVSEGVRGGDRVDDDVGGGIHRFADVDALDWFFASIRH